MPVWGATADLCPRNCYLVIYIDVECGLGLEVTPCLGVKVGSRVALGRVGGGPNFVGRREVRGGRAGALFGRTARLIRMSWSWPGCGFGLNLRRYLPW